MPVDNELMPVEVEVDSDSTELLVELSPVDSEPIELLADDNPVEVDDDSEATLLLVELRPVDSELMPVEVDVDNDSTEL
ncbi:hypothetical protein, partial [Burkholderia pseudomultivorans]|uniref:hypothetical protein n=1 Tax=Burkholderia pseudomultivorans TaxID=1207504 RepID=UPI0028706B55